MPEGRSDPPGGQSGSSTCASLRGRSSLWPRTARLVPAAHAPGVIGVRNEPRSGSFARKPAARSLATLPKALAERAKAQHDAKQARLLVKGRAAIAHIRERQVDIAANMVDIGLALVELKVEGMAEALGRSGFAEVCELDLGLPFSTANVLVALATKVPREVVTRLGTDRARAVLELVEATPENESIEELLRAKLALPSGRALDVAGASTQEPSLTFTNCWPVPIRSATSPWSRMLTG